MIPLPSLFNPPVTARRQTWRWVLPGVLVLLFLGILTGLPWQAQRMESTERQEQLIADTLWVEQTIRFQLDRSNESLRLIASEIGDGQLLPQKFNERAAALLSGAREIKRIGWLAADGHTVASSDTADLSLSLSQWPLAAQEALAHVIDSRVPAYSRPMALPYSLRPVLFDYFVPMFADKKYVGALVLTYYASAILEEMVPWWFAQENQIDLLDLDDKLIARRAAGGPGRGVYTHQRTLDLSGQSVTLRTNSVKGTPRLLPNLLMGSVIALSLGLLWSLWALWRDINRRLATEGALREQVTFRTAMENSLVTGLRARDLEGRVTYANPAFCKMVDMPAERLLGKLPPMPYWAPEATPDYERRFAEVLAGTVTQKGFETIFQRANGERFPVLIFESALRDLDGKQTGWMGSILDISERKQAEELNQRQQEKLQASARLASMGEIASTLAHELNQPLAAISSYTTGALNLLGDPASSGDDHRALLKPALEKAAAQALRAGQIIRSVHAFVKQREPLREAVSMAAIIDTLEPLIALQAQPSFTHVEIAITTGLPAVLGDRVLLEQVLLNLTRNAIESMQQMPPAQRLLRIRLSRTLTATGQPAVLTEIIDQGHGIPENVAERLYSPFFSTKSEGMGMGLNICRTAIEFHGGYLTHTINPAGGTIFQFALPFADDNPTAALPA
ncbi:PAS domain S-box protein [Actimicrobium sp. CCC2.4]|uniref:sensor histidine kinase n=1 Tax=Actimicrobium sp. CCC2.4 TaxID=3048606 RepID=UPI002AC9B81A|nr:PAS domain S-box protein [Actimicrobium sp. CCC2.4]MEB0137020.1 PAS domain S-box protein [Actimicrobium sp. CCC2.4]WPX32243.1 PAS domain S-box protein [Actimicrobium sp. CCC2.4]